MSTPGPKPQAQAGSGDKSAPKPPAHVTGEALAEWKRVVPLLKARGVLAKADRFALAAYCIAYARWQTAEQHIAEDGGAIVLSPKTNVPMQHPELSIANAAMKACLKIATEFGFTPSSRARATAAQDDTGPDIEMPE